MSKMRLAEAIQKERRRRSWSQTQLAVAAGVSRRTIQRVEATGCCSHETLLSIAASLDVDVVHFTALAGEPGQSRSTRDASFGAASEARESLRSILVFRPLAGVLTPRQLGLVSLLGIFPALYFAAANVLRPITGFEWLYQPWDLLLSDPQRLAVFNAVSPALFLGGLLFALVVNVSAIVGMEISKSNEALSGTITLKLMPRRWTAIATTLILLGMLVGYGSKYIIADVIEVLLAHLG